MRAQVGFKHVVHDQFRIVFAPADGGPLGMLERLAAGAATGEEESMGGVGCSGLFGVTIALTPCCYTIPRPPHNVTVVAGVLKTMLFYPLDLSRTRITADLAARGQPRNYATVRQCLATTVVQVGLGNGAYVSRCG